MASYHPTQFSNLPNWPGQLTQATMNTFLKSCIKLTHQPHWQDVCKKAKALSQEPKAWRAFFETEFTPWQIVTPSTNYGLITGYYEPLLRGERLPRKNTPYSIYGIPKDMWQVLFPNTLHDRSVLVVRPLANQKMAVIANRIKPDKNEYILYPKKFWFDRQTTILSTRMVGNELIPYYTRSEIHQGYGVKDAPVIAWLENWVDLAYLQIQGSGRIQLEDNHTIRISYAASNGHPFVSIAKWLIKSQKLSTIQASQTGIKRWLNKHPTEFKKILTVNPHYVFFKEARIAEEEGPIGALGVPLSSTLSVAVDERYIPLGAPVYIATQHTTTNQLVFAQDKGSAIKGPLRLDWFLGYGKQAGLKAEKMHQLGSVWLFLPNHVVPSDIGLDAD
ncbi:MAG: MltA domain-containing protein [Neisseriales bacterium]|nr:MAG: MltA domain-containing protein [Neisseriales bacterium]